MTPTIHCVRHAQGYHNLSVVSHSIHDPLLTPYGEDQCQSLQRTFPDLRNVDLVVASPLRRALDTALLSFEPVLREKNLQVIALPELQENGDSPCDTGSSLDELRMVYQGKPVDLSLVEDDWKSKELRFAFTATAIEKRARDARVWLMNRPERHIVVVSHGGFLHYLTEDWTDEARFSGTDWANTEFRTFSFTSYEPGEGHLIETPESRHGRLGDEKPLDHNEATQLQRTATSEREREELEQSQAAGPSRTGQVEDLQVKA